MAASMGMQTVGVGGGVAGPMCRAIGQADPVPPSLGQERVCPPGGVGSSRDALGLGCRGLSCQLVFFLGAGVQVCMCAETLDLLGVLLSSPLYRPACWATWPHHEKTRDQKSEGWRPVCDFRPPHTGSSLHVPALEALLVCSGLRWPRATSLVCVSWAWGLWQWGEEGWVRACRGYRTGSREWRRLQKAPSRSQHSLAKVF